MAPSKISEKQWRELEPRVKELFRQHVPLKCKDGSRRTVSDILRQETGLAVTVSQLEARLKAWNVAKKLKLAEWEIVMPLLERLEASGTKYQLWLAEQQIKDSAIQRAKRVLKGRSPTGEAEPSLQSMNELEARRISIKVPADGDQWVDYRGTEARVVRSPSQPLDLDLGFDGPPAAPESTEMALLLSHNGPLETHTFDQLQIPDPAIPEWAMPAFSGMFGPTACNDWFFDLDFISRTFSPLKSFPCSPLSLPVDRNLSPSPSPRAPPDLSQSTDMAPISGSISWSSPRFRRISGLLQTIIRQAFEINDKRFSSYTSLRDTKDVTPKQRLPEVEELFERLFALLPQRESERILGPNTGMEPESAVREMFLHSIVNNFAGLQDIPLEGVLGLLKNDRQMIAELFRRLRDDTQALAKTVVDNLFRAAVEAGDVQAVELIIAAVSGQPYAINPDDVVCQDDGEACTPLELAAERFDIDMASILVRLGADVNKSLEGQDDEHLGPLWRVLCLEYSEVINERAFEMLSFLLKKGAKVTSEHVKLALILDYKKIDTGLDICIALMERLHEKFEIGLDHYQKLILVSKMACHPDRQKSTNFFRLLLCLCTESGRCGCVTALRMRFLLAATSGNLELSKLFLQHGLPVTLLSISCAIRGGNCDIIDLMLDQGIDPAIPFERQLDCPKEFLKHMDLEERDPKMSIFLYPTSPLAEAIRARNHRLVWRLEQSDAWRHVRESATHFEAVAIAAAEVGDLPRLRRTLDTIPNFTPRYAKSKFPGGYLTLALMASIRSQETEAIRTLMDAEAREWVYGYDRRFYSALSVAIEQRNRPLVYELLETDVNLLRSTPRELTSSDPMTLAVEWGNISLIRDLLHMRIRFNLTPALGQAIRSKSKEIVKILVENGANVAYAEEDKHSPLREAIQLEDDEIVDILLSGRITSFDFEAFHFTITSNSRYLGVLFELYKAKAPDFLAQYAYSFISYAIEANNIGALQLFLDGGLSANAFGSRIDFASPLDLHSRTGSSLGCAIENAQNLDIIRTLIDAGADVNSIVAAPNGVGQDIHHSSGTVTWPRETALLVAIRCGHKDVVSLLLERGADVNRAARLGVKRTPLQAACEKGSWRIMQMLLENGADVNAPPAQRGGGTALQLAAMGGYVRIVEHLLSLGASVHAAPSRVKGRTALEAAAERGRINLLDVLWAARGPAGFPADEVRRAIEHASKNGHRGCAGYIWFLWHTQQPNAQELLCNV